MSRGTAGSSETDPSASEDELAEGLVGLPQHTHDEPLLLAVHVQRYHPHDEPHQLLIGEHHTTQHADFLQVQVSEKFEHKNTAYPFTGLTGYLAPCTSRPRDISLAFPTKGVEKKKSRSFID